MKVAFDSRPAADRRGIGRYTRSLLGALRDEARARGGEIVEAGRPRGADLFHAPTPLGGAIGASTIGSSEAVMLAGMAMKWRWRQLRGEHAASLRIDL